MGCVMGGPDVAALVLPSAGPDPIPTATALAAARGARGAPDAPALGPPSAGPDAIPMATARAAVLGYASGRRPLFFRSPSSPQGRWVQVLAFAHARFAARPPGAARRP